MGDLERSRDEWRAFARKVMSERRSLQLALRQLLDELEANDWSEPGLSDALSEKIDAARLVLAQLPAVE